MKRLAQMLEIAILQLVCHLDDSLALMCCVCPTKPDTKEMKAKGNYPLCVRKQHLKAPSSRWLSLLAAKIWGTAGDVG